MDRYTRILLANCPSIGPRLCRRSIALKHLKNSPKDLRKVTRNIDAALEHFDATYLRVYGKRWPSVRLGLLSPRKYCAILNTFTDSCEVPDEAIDLQKYYAKRLRVLENVADRQTAKTNQIDAVADNDIGEPANASTDLEKEESGEDLVSMFEETSYDDEDRPFINQASKSISLNDYVPATELIFHENVPTDCVHYDGTIRDVDKNIQMIDHAPLVHQEHLKIYTFPRGHWTRFEPPSVVPKADIFSHYLMDGASILPVLILEPKFDDICADYCAAPGGKSLALAMTLKPKFLLCNDISHARLRRLQNVVRQYIPEVSYARSLLNFSAKDSRELVYQDTFDKILVDAPCSNDRNSVESVENNIFKRTRTEERLSLPSNQCDILKSALKSLKIGGDVVYSTCTLSPLENDAVVKRSLLQLREEAFPASYAVMNLRQPLRPFNRLFTISGKFVYGQQILPNVCSNFGPMYISKIRRIS